MVWFLTYAWHAFSMQNPTYVITFFLSSAGLFTLKASISTVHFSACPQTNCLFVFTTIFKSGSTSLEHVRIVLYEKTQKHWSPKCAHVSLKKDMEIILCCAFLSLWSLLSFFINCPLPMSLQAANVATDYSDTFTTKSTHREFLSGTFHNQPNRWKTDGKFQGFYSEQFK